MAANVQAGKTNTQTIGNSTTQAPSVVVRPKARVDTVDQSTNKEVNNELPVYVWVIGILLFIVGWVTDTPSTYVSNLRRKRRG